jgi:hypothetical protein
VSQVPRIEVVMSLQEYGQACNGNRLAPALKIRLSVHTSAQWQSHIAQGLDTLARLSAPFSPMRFAAGKKEF